MAKYLVTYANNKKNTVEGRGRAVECGWRWCVTEAGSCRLTLCSCALGMTITTLFDLSVKTTVGVRIVDI